MWSSLFHVCVWRRECRWAVELGLFVSLRCNHQDDACPTVGTFQELESESDQSENSLGSVKENSGNCLESVCKQSGNSPGTVLDQSGEQSWISLKQSWIRLGTAQVKSAG